MAEKSFNRVINATRAQIRTYKKLLIIIIILLLMGSIFVGIGTATSLKENNAIFSYDTATDTGFLFYIASILCGFLLTVDLFKDMHSKQYADIMLSMPLTAVQRYVSKLLTILFIQIIPTILSCVVSFALTFIFAPVKEEIRTLDYVLVGVDFRKNILLGSAKTSLIILLMLISAILFTSAVAIFTSCCCGSRIEAYMFSVLNIFCISIMSDVVFENIVFKFSQIQSEFPISYWGYPASIADNNIPTAISCLISLMVIVAALFIYKKRDAVKIGKPVVFRWFFNAEMIFGIIIVNLMFMSIDLFIWGEIITFVGFIIMQIILSRGSVKFKKVLSWIGGYLVTVALLTGIMATSYFTNGFGYDIEISGDFNVFDVAISVYTSDDVYNFSIADDRIITDEQANTIKDIFTNYRDRQEKSWSKFFETIVFNPYGYDYEYDYQYQTASCSFYEYYDQIGSIDLSLSPNESRELYEELKSLSFISVISYDDYVDDYYDYDEEYYEK